LPFLPLFDGVSEMFSFQTLNSSRAGRIGDLTFRVMGGKGGKIMAKTARCAARFRAIPARFGASSERLRDVDARG
jgi:hypothetical protein